MVTACVDDHAGQVAEQVAVGAGDAAVGEAVEESDQRVDARSLRQGVVKRDGASTTLGQWCDGLDATPIRARHDVTDGDGFEQVRQNPGACVAE